MDCRICLVTNPKPIGDAPSINCNNCIFPLNYKEYSTGYCTSGGKEHCMIPVKTENNAFGFITLRVTEELQSNVLAAFFHFGQMVALILENRRFRAQLEDFKYEKEPQKSKSDEANQPVSHPAKKINLPFVPFKEEAGLYNHETEEKFSAVFGNSPVSFLLSMPFGGAILEVNEIFLKDMGYEREEVIGHTTTELCLFFDPEEQLTLREELKRKQCIQGKECRFKTKSGAIRTGLVSISFLTIGGQTLQMSVVTDITERKLVEENLALSEELFRKAFYISPDAININRLADGWYVNINRGFTEIMGYTEADIIGKTSLETNIWVNPLNRQALVEGLINEGYVSNLEAKFRKKDGTETTGLMSASIIELGGIPHILSVTRDIGNLKKIQNTLQENEELFRRIFQEGKISLALCGKDSNFLKVNDSFCKLTGYTENELLSMKLTDIAHPDDAERELNLVKRLYDGSLSVYQAENRYLDKDQREVWAAVSLSPMRDPQGNFIYFIVAINDITERRLAEEALKKNNFRLELAMQSAKMAWWEMDFKTGLITFDRRKSEMIDLPPERFKHYNDFLHLVHPDDVSGIIQSMEKHLDGTVDKYEAEYRLLTSSGTYKWFYDIGTVVRENESEIPVKVNGLVIDISERKQNEAELIKSKDLAEQSDRLKTAFLANMSHEIRTPMNGILGFASLLKIPNLTGDEKQSYIALIERSGVRMLNIINDLITISKVESGLMDLVVSKTNVNDQLDFLHNFFKTEASQKGIPLTVHCPLPLKEAIVATDREKLYSILSNLIKNALKFTKAGSVEFGYHARENYLEFYVKDTGMGIPKEKQDAVFNRFVQADSSLSRGYEGAGLGLSISKAYVEMLGGSIWMESESGKGTLVSFSLPRRQVKGTEELPVEMAEPVAWRKSQNNIILIADDDEDSMLYLSIILGNTGSKIYKAVTGEQAVEFCRNQPDINLVLMDIKMPKMDGYSAAKLIREFRPDLPIIAQTAYALDKEKAKYGGIFNSYLTKPVRADELKQKIKNYLFI